MTPKATDALEGAWYVKDFADGWIKFHDPAMALREAQETGAIMRWSHTDPNIRAALTAAPDTPERINQEYTLDRITPPGFVLVPRERDMETLVTAHPEKPEDVRIPNLKSVICWLDVPDRHDVAYWLKEHEQSIRFALNYAIHALAAAPSPPHENNSETKLVLLDRDPLHDETSTEDCPCCGYSGLWSPEKWDALEDLSPAIQKKDQP